MNRLLFFRRLCNSPFLSQEPRVNQLGIQYLSEELQKKIFPRSSTKEYLNPKRQDFIDLAKKHLEENHLLGKKTTITDPIRIKNFPDLNGKSLDEHFYKIGTTCSEPYKSMADAFLLNGNIPQKPKEWSFQSGWTRYENGKEPENVEYPLEDSLVFDVEVLYRVSKYPVLATCVSLKAWYGWVSPLLTDLKSNSSPDFEHLIPLNTIKSPKLVIGYNVSYDRARVLEEYNIRSSNAFFLDGMALHVAVSGICSQQRPMWQKYKKSVTQGATSNEELTDAESSLSYDRQIAQELSDDPWLDKGATNSLASVADFHCGIKMDKSDRDYFSELDPKIIVDSFNQLMTYCAGDVEATFAVTKKLYPEFIKKAPHPVSFAALKVMGSLMLPTTSNWESYTRNSEKVYQQNREEVGKILKERANSLVQYIIADKEGLKPNWEEDPWLRQLNWTLKERRLKKNGEPFAKQAYLTGYPEWYRELFRTSVDTDGVREMNLTVRSRVTPLLLKLKWEGFPLLWTDSAGWCFKVPFEDELIDDLQSKNYIRPKLSEEEFEKLLPELRDSHHNFELFKVPHPEGSTKRCTSIMSKSYLRYFENGILTSEYPYAQDILKLNSAASYWMGNRQRIMDQFVVYSNSNKNQFWRTKKEASTHKDMGIILPVLCTMGTITRRATENTWLTASNAKANRIGSELKAMIEAPEGYCFVGADVDSEELWIASIIGDSIFGIHGGTALGWMTLEGDKNEKTDLHSKTAEILGISRDDAKVFNYGRIYGAGVKFASRLLKQCNSKLSDEESEKIAKNLYSKTKGQTSSSKFLERRLYHGGSESIIFNALEAIANEEEPRTPVLGAAITDALVAKNLNKNNYLTSRINWTIQSSGVDYLHLLITSMDYLLQKYQLEARLALTVHDEIRYLAKEKDRYIIALLLQISNLWTRAMFSELMGIPEVPQSCAFFSEVDLDKVLRKDVSLTCVTPSHPTAIPPGKSLDIRELLKICDDGEILSSMKKKRAKMNDIKYIGREVGTPSLDRHLSKRLRIAKAKMQISTDHFSWRKSVNQYIRLKKSIEFEKEECNERWNKKSGRVNKTKNSGPPKKKIDEIDISGIGNEMLAREIEMTDAHFSKKESKKVNESNIYNNRSYIKSLIDPKGEQNYQPLHGNQQNLVDNTNENFDGIENFIRSPRAEVQMKSQSSLKDISNIESTSLFQIDLKQEKILIQTLTPQVSSDPPFRRRKGQTEQPEPPFRRRHQSYFSEVISS
ncbi:uncharacterized protein PRCAT00002807001 [Priceomyces carsonii]|uniref:uncharacterized protein n=1 Tax=Priceomyces carsonii TaxID=28549 RepID=UPI002EDB6450|nr:unnamed protein product [Priceomyces carsonii]